MFHGWYWVISYKDAFQVGKLRDKVTFHGEDLSSFFETCSNYDGNRHTSVHSAQQKIRTDDGNPGMVPFFKLSIGSQ